METGEGRKEADSGPHSFFFFFFCPSLLLYFSRRLEACGPTVCCSVKLNPTGQFCKYRSWQCRGTRWHLSRTTAAEARRPARLWQSGRRHRRRSGAFSGGSGGGGERETWRHFVESRAKREQGVRAGQREKCGPTCHWLSSQLEGLVLTSELQSCPTPLIC